MSQLTIEPSNMKAASKKDRSLEVSYKSAFASILIGNAVVVKEKIRICSIMFIENRTPGNGNVGKLIQYLEGYARQCRCKEIWFPTVLSEKLADMLKKNGYQLQCHTDSMAGQVDVFVKEFKKK